ncbi:hypothetical protein QYE76_025111 [Lolium multiflorum]|uniref:Uncharacterized protein n=1 Tax=Lolium multiflorum TaxID=4521 RepID=A0AAD8VUC7_LOLMU|nr:hypothetical protein QYE76_025111 [Lolium multiflorum]
MKWEAIREDEKRKATFEDRRIWLDEEKEENWVMMMDPTTMDAVTKEWWEIRRAEILEAKKARREASSAAAVDASAAATAATAAVAASAAATINGDDGG